MANSNQLLIRGDYILTVQQFAGFMASLHQAMLKEFTSTPGGKAFMEKARTQNAPVMPETFEIFWCSQPFKVLESNLDRLAPNAWRLYPKWLKKKRISVRDVLPLKKKPTPSTAPV